MVFWNESRAVHLDAETVTRRGWSSVVIESIDRGRHRSIYRTAQSRALRSSGVHAFLMTRLPTAITKRMNTTSTETHAR